MVTYQHGLDWMTLREATEAGIKAAFARGYGEHVLSEVYHHVIVVITVMKSEQSVNVFHDQVFESYFVPLSRAPPEFALAAWPSFQIMPEWLEGLYAASPTLSRYVPDEETKKRAMERQAMFIRGGTVFSRPFKMLSSRVVPLNVWI